MEQTPASLLRDARHFAGSRRALFFLVGIALATSGCGIRKRPSIPWATAVQVRPVVQTASAVTSVTLDDPAPEFALELPPFATLLPVRSGPPRPHVATPPSSGSTGSDSEKLTTPMIAPPLSAQETVAARQETSQSLEIAQKNLAGARGKALNAMQADLVSKINGFLKDAREAVQSGDWSRARSLAKKAEVLSDELAKSFS